ncbi:hypothetical protein DPMN_178521 [Dreissena polymorpha]|uniref:Uncharacterized protein n=1 Tax=Dreissena polymorpha TaxID=45954 RepID=A0A9D4ECC1_DREPO|nr:hypothetical protein DPMN_178521 [Dreissena polymorpha]
MDLKKLQIPIHFGMHNKLKHFNFQPRQVSSSTSTSLTRLRSRSPKVAGMTTWSCGTDRSDSRTLSRDSAATSFRSPCRRNLAFFGRDSRPTT